MKTGAGKQRQDGTSAAIQKTSLPGASYARLIASCFGVFLGLSLLKFGNPPILERFVSVPGDVFELVLGYPWPIGWAYGVLFLLVAASLKLLFQPLTAPKWLLTILLLWVLWQWLAASESVDQTLSNPTFRHLLAAAVCFCMGALVLARAPSLNGFLLALLIGYALVLLEGWQQRFGGLEAARNYFWQNIYPTATNIPPEYYKKMSSNRIWATLFYPNTLAGALLLLLPVSVVCAWRFGANGRMTPAARMTMAALIALAGLACLVWCGSKGGWLLMLMLGVVALLHVELSRTVKMAVIGVLLVAGLTGFFLKYAAFFEKGATSVSARFDYWQAAVQTAKAHPWLGSGPGTFAIAYKAVKRPESEMARLVHNDYLEQASDSGWPACVLYAVFIVASLILAYPGRIAAKPPSKAGPLSREVAFALWLGVLGWALQGMSEFGLYIPALAWPAFTFLGLLVGCNHPKRLDIPKPTL